MKTEMKTTNILGVPINIITLHEATNKLYSFLRSDSSNVVVTPNPEIVMKCTKDEKLLNIIKSANLVVPDGIGIVLASKLNKNKIKERVPGIDLVTNFFENAKEDITVYLLGARPGVCELAKQNIQKTYKNIKIIGYHSGYFNDDTEKLIINEINGLNPQVILVGLGAPKQEFWIHNNKSKFNVKILIGVGGAIDVFSGQVRRAPTIFIKLNLEWFYRLLSSPKRIFRLLYLPMFVFNVLSKKLFEDLRA